MEAVGEFVIFDVSHGFPLGLEEFRLLATADGAVVVFVFEFLVGHFRFPLYAYIISPYIFLSSVLLNFLAAQDHS
jgi:hypothetical protein